MEKRDDDWYTDLKIESEVQDLQGGYMGTLQSTKEYEVHERQTCRISVQSVQLEGGIVQIIDAGSKKRARTDTTSTPNIGARTTGDGPQVTSEKKSEEV